MSVDDENQSIFTVLNLTLCPISNQIWFRLWCTQASQGGMLLVMHAKLLTVDNTYFGKIKFILDLMQFRHSAIILCFYRGYVKFKEHCAMHRHTAK